MGWSCRHRRPFIIYILIDDDQLVVQYHIGHPICIGQWLWNIFVSFFLRPEIWINIRNSWILLSRLREKKRFGRPQGFWHLAFGFVIALSKPSHTEKMLFPFLNVSKKEKTVVLNCWEKKIKDCPRVFFCFCEKGKWGVALGVITNLAVSSASAGTLKSSPLSTSIWKT